MICDICLNYKTNGTGMILKKIVEQYHQYQKDEIYKMLIFFERRWDVILAAEHGTKYFLHIQCLVLKT